MKLNDTKWYDLYLGHLHTNEKLILNHMISEKKTSWKNETDHFIQLNKQM